jgi:hypothetical protein
MADDRGSSDPTTQVFASDPPAMPANVEDSDDRRSDTSLAFDRRAWLDLG